MRYLWMKTARTRIQAIGRVQILLCRGHVAQAQGDGVEKYADGFKIRTHESALAIRYGWKKPAMVFVNSMSYLLLD